MIALRRFGPEFSVKRFKAPRCNHLDGQGGSRWRKELGGDRKPIKMNGRNLMRCFNCGATKLV